MSDYKELDDISREDLIQKFKVFYNKFKEYEQDNERLRKCVHNMYNEFNKFSLLFLLNSNLSENDKNTFKECFQKYLK